MPLRIETELIKPQDWSGGRHVLGILPREVNDLARFAHVLTTSVAPGADLGDAMRFPCTTWHADRLAPPRSYGVAVLRALACLRTHVA